MNTNAGFLGLISFAFGHHVFYATAHILYQNPQSLNILSKETNSSWQVSVWQSSIYASGVDEKCKI